MDDNSSIESDSQTFDAFSLKERNTILEQENLSLKSQIQDAINITNKLDQLQKQNLQLSQEVINLKTTNDNLQCRLQISSQTNADLLKSLESAKVSYASQTQNDRLSAQNEATKLKEKYKAHSDQLYNEISQIKAQNDELQINQKVLSTKIQHVLESAAQYFTTKFTTLDDLTTFLKQASLPSPSPTDDCNMQPQSTELIKLIKNLKKKLKSAKSESQKADEKYQEIQVSSTREINTLNRKLEYLKKEKIESDSSYESTIKELNRQLTEAKDTLEATKQELKKSKQTQSKFDLPINLPDHRIQSYDLASEKVSEPIQRTIFDTAQIDLLKSRINDLTAEVSNYQKRQNDLQEQNRKLESAAQNAEIKLTKVSDDLNSLQIVHNESLAEIESLRKSLHERQILADKKPVPIIIQEKPDKKQLARKEARINELTSDLKKKEIENEELCSKVRDLELTLSSKDDEYKKLKSEHNEYVIRAESRHNVTQDDLIPPGSFRYSNFDPELSAEIDKIASNSSLQIPSKIDHIYRTIDQHFTHKICELQRLYEESVQVEVNLRGRVKQFITDVAIELTGQPLPTESSFSSSKGDGHCCPLAIVFQNIECIQKVIFEMVSRLDNVTHEKEQASSLLSQLSSVLQTDDVVTKAGQIMSQIVQLSKRVLMMKKRCKLLAKEGKEKGDKLSANLAQLNSELELSQSNASQLQSKVDSQNDTIKKLHIQIRSLHNELNDASEAKKELEATLTENAENELGSLNSKCRQIESQYSSKINGLQQQITDFQDENSSLQSQLNYLERQNKECLEKIRILNSEKAAMSRENDEKIQSLNKKFDTEKVSLKKSYESAFEEMKKKNEQSRSDIEKLSRSATSKDEAIEELQKSAKVLTLQKVKLSTEVRSLREQIGREKKLAEATLKSQTCSIETKYKEKIESIKAKANEEQQKMLLYVIDAFRTTFCGFIGKMEEKPFKIIIDRIKENYVRLNESDQAIRKMLNVTERQTTQDAVAQLLIDH